VFRTLYSRLALVLSGLFLLVAALFLSVSLFSTNYYLHEANQKLHLNLAKSVVSEGLIGEGGKVEEKRLKEIFHFLMVVNPSIEVYLLDTDGKILAYSAPPGKVKTDRVSLGPIKELLNNPERIPILGDDPRNPQQKTVFSATPTMAGEDMRGYLYVVLAGEQYRSVFQLFRQSYISRLSLGTSVVGLVFALAAGLVFFRLLTRRLQSLTSKVASFQSSDPKLLDQKHAGDEIDCLDAAFDAMSRRIRQQMESLRQVDSERRQLITNISHDLRTPLTSLQGHLETLLLKEGGLNPDEKRQYLNTAVSGSRRLSRLIDELFELAKLDSPETALNAEPFSLPELVQDVLQKFNIAFESKSLQAQVRMPETESEPAPFVCADIALVERVFENLLKNAVRHSPENSAITVRIEATQDGFVETRISDCGMGIDPEDAPHAYFRSLLPGKKRQTRQGRRLGPWACHSAANCRASRRPGVGAKPSGRRSCFLVYPSRST